MTADITLPSNHKNELMSFYNLKYILTESEWIGYFIAQGFKK